MGRKTLWVSPFISIVPMERTDRSFPAGTFFFRAVVLLRRLTSRVINVVSHGVVIRPPKKNKRKKKKILGEDLIYMPSNHWKQGLGSLNDILFAALRYPLPRVYYVHAAPRSLWSRSILPSSSSSSSSFYIEMFFFLLSLWSVFAAFLVIIQ
jgi:hypothetical protein